MAHFYHNERNNVAPYFQRFAKVMHNTRTYFAMQIAPATNVRVCGANTNAKADTTVPAHKIP
jgi:hypothetical protein